MEKGGGKALPSKGLKSSLKTIPSSTKGKDDSSGKSKRGRKVQFGSGAPIGSTEANLDFLSKSDGKFDASAAKGNLSKGGKGDKIANGGKARISKEAQPLQLKVEPELPKNAKCLMDCEAAQILEGIQEQMVLLSQDPTIKLPVSFDKGLQYAKTNARYSNPQSVRRVLENLEKHDVSDGEICVIANVRPETIDEVFALVPSLKPKKSTLREPLKDALVELAKLKQSS